MPIDPDAVLGEPVEGAVRKYHDRDTILYALSTGFGADPIDRRALPFVFEGAGLAAMPTMACVLGTASALRHLDLQWNKVLHVGQSLAMARPLPATGAVASRSRIVSIDDKGAGKGALIRQETELIDADSGDLLAMLGLDVLARGDGGFGGTNNPRQSRTLPERLPDHHHVASTRPDQALLYRLNGDRMPIHADPAVARQAGFERPILHGLCTFGILCRVVLERFADFDPSRVAHLETRFSAPLLPGEDIDFDFWREGDEILFAARQSTRQATILEQGVCRLRGQAALSD